MKFGRIVLQVIMHWLARVWFLIWHHTFKMVGGRRTLAYTATSAHHLLLRLQFVKVIISVYSSWSIVHSFIVKVNYDVVLYIRLSRVISWTVTVLLPCVVTLLHTFLTLIPTSLKFCDWWAMSPAIWARNFRVFPYIRCSAIMIYVRVTSSLVHSTNTMLKFLKKLDGASY